MSDPQCAPSTYEAEIAELTRELQVRKDYDAQTDYPGKIIAAGHRINVLSAENAELKQWMSAACELFHDLIPECPPHLGFETQVLDLLRRAENP